MVRISSNKTSKLLIAKGLCGANDANRIGAVRCQQEPCNESAGRGSFWDERMNEVIPGSVWLVRRGTSSVARQCSVGACSESFSGGYRCSSLSACLCFGSSFSCQSGADRQRLSALRHRKSLWQLPQRPRWTRPQRHRPPEQLHWRPTRSPRGLF